MFTTRLCSDIFRSSRCCAPLRTRITSLLRVPNPSVQRLHVVLALARRDERMHQLDTTMHFNKFSRRLPWRNRILRHLMRCQMTLLDDCETIALSYIYFGEGTIRPLASDCPSRAHHRPESFQSALYLHWNPEKSLLVELPSIIYICIYNIHIGIPYTNTTIVGHTEYPSSSCSFYVKLSTNQKCVSSMSVPAALLGNLRYGEQPSNVLVCINAYSTRTIQFWIAFVYISSLVLNKTT